MSIILLVFGIKPRYATLKVQFTGKMKIHFSNHLHVDGKLDEVFSLVIHIIYTLLKVEIFTVAAKFKVCTLSDVGAHF